MKIVFAPDYRDGNPYQDCLAQHLNSATCEVTFLSGYRRVLPLARGTRAVRPDVLHLHWPEAYFHGSRLRELRYPVDLRLAHCCRKLVLTAHNLFPHLAADRALVRRNISTTFKRADAVIAHSDAAQAAVVETFRIPHEKIHVIQHGDLSGTLPPLIGKGEARQRLDLPQDERICLMFGRVSPYKGIADAIANWPATDVRLAIVGDCPDRALAAELAAAAGNVHLRLNRCSDEELSLWLSAADATLFNYRHILTSGSACLARSLGIPILIPARLATIDLAEPSRHVHRFDRLTPDVIERAAGQPRGRDDAYRQLTAWPTIAAAHDQVYASL